MKLVFRADASLIAGTGHVMRLYAIAEEAISRGIESYFVGNYLEVKWLSEKIDSLGFSAINPGLNNLQDMTSDAILILDSYSIATEDKFISGGNWQSVITIVDKQTPAYICDLAIHPGLSATWSHAHFPKFLYGPQFVPVRKEILKLKNDLDLNFKKVRNILIVGGGTDPFRFNLAIAHKLKLIDGDFEFVFLTKDSVEIEMLDPRFKCKPIGAGLITEIELADLVISAASSSSLEFLALNKIMATCALVDNQVEHYEYLEENSLAQCLGVRRDDDADYISLDLLKEVMCDQARQKLIRGNVRSLIDGYGAKRIVDLILDISLSGAKELQ